MLQSTKYAPHHGKTFKLRSTNSHNTSIVSIVYLCRKLQHKNLYTIQETAIMKMGKYIGGTIYYIAPCSTRKNKLLNTNIKHLLCIGHFICATQGEIQISHKTPDGTPCTNAQHQINKHNNNWHHFKHKIQAVSNLQSYLIVYTYCLLPHVSEWERTGRKAFKRSRYTVSQLDPAQSL